MSRRPASLTQADVARVLRAAKQTGAAEVEVVNKEGERTIYRIDQEGTWPDLGGEIYFIANGDWVKIGFAVDVDSRLKALQAANPEGLVVLYTEPGPMQAEREYHKKFAHLRGRGEWFRREGELAIWLAERVEK